MMMYDVLVHDVDLAAGESALVHLPDDPGAGRLLPVVIPHHAVRVNVSRRPRPLAHLVIDLGGPLDQ